jgi:hypothetical protein
VALRLAGGLLLRSLLLLLVLSGKNRLNILGKLLVRREASGELEAADLSVSATKNEDGELNVGDQIARALI